MTPTSSSETKSSASLETTGFYRGYDNDDFPVANYALKQTNKLLTIYSYVSNDTLVWDKKQAHELLEKLGFKRLYIREWNNYDAVYGNAYYELKNEEDNTIMLLNIAKMAIPRKNAKIKKEEEQTSGLTFYSNFTEENFRKIYDQFWAISKKRKFKSNNIALVVASRNGFDTRSFKLPKQQLDLELNYGKDFVPVHKKVLNALNKPKGKGLVLLHGDPGTGKTHYLKHLASQIKDKKVLFIPPYLVDFITSPDMTPFLIENSNSVLFIEDAEKVITDRNTTGSVGVSNILNLTDGILSDILNIQVVATFNMDKKKIDEALLRKGRLIAEHKFGKLSITECNNLIKHLEIKDYIATEPMTLTEIYNIEEQEFKSEKRQKIGFN